MPTNRPRGRRPGRTETRSEILAAALKLFSEVGYEKVSLRAIAREAEVDPALIHHYFDDKADLFEKAVLDLPLDDAEKLVATILDGPAEETGVRVATAFLEAWEKALAMAGISLDDLSLVETHDCFTVAEMIEYEAMGLMPRGEGWHCRAR